MLIDSARLGWRKREGKIFVCYPKRDPNGELVYGGGTQVDFPEWYFTNPPNAITAERVAIVDQLVEETP